MKARNSVAFGASSLQTVSRLWHSATAWRPNIKQIKYFPRTMEWVLAVAWPIVTYNVIFNRYGWSSQYYNKWAEVWFALALLIPMVCPLVVRLFSATNVDGQKRVAISGLMALGVILAIKFRPMFGGLSVMGFYVPMALHAAAVYLWFAWRNKKHLPTQ